MQGKGKIIGIVIAALVIVAAAAFYLLKKESAEESASSPVPAATETAPASNTSTATSTSTETNAMTTKYDLTAQADGLSKAVATMTLDKGGVIKFRFFTNDAPNTAKRIAQLVSEGFYNGIKFHRVIPGFVAQAGDPTGTGAGGSGTKLKAEFNSHLHEMGIWSMARTADPNSADSQFFIMLGRAPHLDNQYTVFGKVVEGLDNVPKINQGDTIKTFTIE
ncbi:MAG: peptidylprolyl isomerase [Bdellovibrionota bacterium]